MIITNIKVISHFSMPKRTGPKASHKYCCSFTIIDPTTLGHRPIAVNWFFNELEGHQLKYQVGDVIFGDGFARQTFGDNIQLVGKKDKHKLFVFHSKNDYLKGLAQPEKEITTFVENYTKGIRQKDRFLLSPNNWEIIVYGKQSNDTSFTAAMSLCIYYLIKWSEYQLSTESLHDVMIGDLPLHKVMTQLSIINQKLPYYEALIPKSPLNAHGMFGSIKCDLVCLVIHRLLPVHDIESTRLIVWDGTTNGEFRLNYDHFAQEMTAQQAIEQVCQYMQPHDHNPLYTPLELSWNSTLPIPTTATATAATRLPPTSHSEDNHDLVLSHLHTSKSLLGLPIIICGLDDEFNHYLHRFAPGSWIRIRNLFIDVPNSNIHNSMNTPNFFYGIVRKETSIIRLQSYH